jgi:hypothetical protein
MLLLLLLLLLCATEAQLGQLSLQSVCPAFRAKYGTAIRDIYQIRQQQQQQQVLQPRLGCNLFFAPHTAMCRPAQCSSKNVR